MPSNSVRSSGERDRHARARLQRLERWTKIVGITATVFGISWTAWTYIVESDARNFDRRQKAWAAINEQARDVNCSWQNRTTHTNTGHIDAIEFLASQNASMSGIGLPCSEFGSMRAAGARMSNSSLWYSNFAKADLSRAELSSAKLPFSQMSGANLAYADLSNIVMTGITGHWTKFMHAKANGANFQGSDLTNASFRDAELRSADLRFAQLTRADFTGAKLKDAKLDGACVQQDVDGHGDRNSAPIGWPNNLQTLPVCPANWRRREHD